MDADDAAAQAVRAVPGDGAVARATRLAVAHVLAVEDYDERDRWRSTSRRARRRSSTNARRCPARGMTDPEVVRALREANGRIGHADAEPRLP
jgi:hypothetical protein